MKHKMFVVFDTKANAYMQPWFLTQEGMATRAFTDCVNDPNHNFGRHPEDYILFDIGEFDDQTADIKWQAPRSLGNGIEFKTQQELFPDTLGINKNAQKNLVQRNDPRNNSGEQA